MPTIKKMYYKFVYENVYFTQNKYKNPKCEKDNWSEGQKIN